MTGLTISEARFLLVEFLEGVLGSVPLLGLNKPGTAPEKAPYAVLNLTGRSWTRTRDLGVGEGRQKGKDAIIQLFCPVGVGEDDLEALAEALMQAGEHYEHPDNLFGFGEVDYRSVGKDPHGKYQVNVFMPYWYWTGNV